MAALRNLVRDSAAVLLIFGGAAWENLFGPSPVGWGFVLVGLLLNGWQNKRLWPATPLRWPLWLLAGMAALSLWVTADLATTVVAVNGLLAALLLLWATAGWATNTSRLIVTAVFLTLIGVGLALTAPVTVAWHQNKAGLIPQAVYDLFPLLLPDAVHPNIMAALLVMLLPVPLSVVLAPAARRARWLQIGAALAALLLLFVLLLTRSRGGYAAAGAGMLLVLWLSGRRRWAIGAALLGGVAVLALLLTGQGAAPETPALSAELTDASTLAFRLRVWELALWMLRDFPFTGVGMSTFNAVGTRLYPFPPVPSPGAHNLYLQAAADLGLPALIALLAILLATLVVGWQNVRFYRRDPRLQPLAIGLLAGVAAMMLHGLLDVTVWGTRMAFLPWLLIGVVWGMHRLRMETAAAPSPDSTTAAAPIEATGTAVSP